MVQLCQGQIVIPADSTLNRMPVDPAQIFMLEDPAHQFKFQQLLDQPEHFLPSTETPPVNQRNYKSLWWTRLDIHNARNHKSEWWMHIPGDEITVWIKRASGHVETHQTGLLLPRTEKVIPQQYDLMLNYVPILLEPGELVTVLVRLDHPTQRTNILSSALTLVQPDYAQIQIVKHDGQTHSRTNFFLAIFLLVALYSLVYFSYTKDRFSLYLMIFCVLMSTQFMIQNGYLYDWFFHRWPILINYVSLIIISLFSALSIAFLRQYINLKQLLPQWDFILWLLILWYLIGGTLVFLVYVFTFNYNLVDSLNTIVYLFPMFPSFFYFFSLVKIKQTDARFLFVAHGWSFLTTLLIIYFLTNGSRDEINLAIQLWGSGFVTILTLGLGYRAAQNLHEKVAANQEKELESMRLQEAHKLNLMKSEFLANISHEFRTPLTLTFGPLDDLLNGHFGPIPGSAKPHLTRARENGNRLLRLINQLLDLSKLDAGVLKLHPKRLDLVGFLEQRLALFKSLAETQNLALQFHSPPGSFFFRFDPEKMEEVFINLISNATKFTPSGGIISVTLVGTPDEHATITVSDTGTGIAAEKLPHIFDRFYQVDGTSRRGYEGTGIGLALVKQLVELHAGTIVATSHPGTGTTFTITLPNQPVPAHAEIPNQDADLHGKQAAPPEAAISLPSHPPAAPPFMEPVAEDSDLILLVEDNADMRAYIRAHLEGTYQILETLNGEEGLKKAIETVPDLVLTDLMMPKMDGLSLCTALREDERTSHIPVVMLTAKNDVESRLAGLEQGADDYLPKPFNADELRLRLRNLIQMRRHLQQVFGKGDKPLDKTAARPIKVPPREAAFINRISELIQEHLSNSLFNIELLADEMHMSRRQLSRKLKALTGFSPAQYLIQLRMEKAKTLLTSNDSLIKEVADAVGYKSVSQFGQQFKKYHGVSPSDI